MSHPSAVTGLRLWPGSLFGLVGRTALAIYRPPAPIDPSSSEWPSLEGRLLQAIETCFPEPVPGLGAQQWPQALVDSPPGATRGMAEWFVALVVTLQRWAHEPVWKGRVIRETPSGTMVALPWSREPSLHTGIGLAERLLNAWWEDRNEIQALSALRTEVATWIAANRSSALPPSAQRFALGAMERRWPVSIGPGLIRIGWGERAERLDNTFTGRTSVIAANLARNKYRTNVLLHGAGVPVPAGVLVTAWEPCLEAARRLGWPLVIKPMDLDLGEGVVADIRDEQTLRHAFAAALKLCPRGVLVERHVQGADHRLLVVEGQVRLAARRTPAGVRGDGRRTVRQLVQDENASPRRRPGKSTQLVALELDDEAIRLLAEQGLTPERAPSEGQFVFLRRQANLARGGTAEDVTADVHPDNRKLAERAAKVVGLNVAGVDLICPDIRRSWREVGGAICEVNGQPGLRVHWVNEGARNINGDILEWMLGGRDVRIPVAAVVGSVHAGGVARLLHHLWLEQGVEAGVCSEQGIRLGADLVVHGSAAGFQGARLVLEDPSAQAAALALPWGDLLQRGHPCDRYTSVAVVDLDGHQPPSDSGLPAVSRLELLADTLQRSGETIVVRAEDVLQLESIGLQPGHRIILVASDDCGQPMASHLAKGGEGVFRASLEGTPVIVLARGTDRQVLARDDTIESPGGSPALPSGRFVLMAVALAWAHGIPVAAIRSGLKSYGR